MINHIFTIAHLFYLTANNILYNNKFPIHYIITPIVRTILLSFTY